MVHCHISKDTSGTPEIAKITKVHLTVKTHQHQVLPFMGLHCPWQAHPATGHQHSQPVSQCLPCCSRHIGQAPSHHHEWGRKGNAERECEDIHLARWEFSNAMNPQEFPRPRLVSGPGLIVRSGRQCQARSPGQVRIISRPDPTGIQPGP